MTGVGYDKRRVGNVNSSDNEIPNKQLYILPNQIASLTLDRLIFGEVPLFSRERRLLFVKNNSLENSVSFNWHVTNPEHVKVYS